MTEKTANDANFDELVMKQQDKPVLVDFWASWCGPCRIQTPIIEEASKELGAKAVVVKVEVDEAPQTAAKFNILSIPTLAIFKDGKMVWQAIGVHQKQALIEEIEKQL